MAADRVSAAALGLDGPAGGQARVGMRQDRPRHGAGRGRAAAGWGGRRGYARVDGRPAAGALRDREPPDRGGRGRGRRADGDLHPGRPLPGPVAPAGHRERVDRHLLRRRCVISTPAMASVPTPAPASGDGEPRCAWCSAPIDPATPHPERRVPCARCGAQTTWPVPTDAELEAAYGTWYRPGAGRFSGARRSPAAAASRPARRPRRLDRPAGLGSRRRRRGRGAARRARGDRAGRGRPRASFRAPRRARGSSSRTTTSPCAAIVFWHSLEHLRDAGAALDHAASLLDPDGVVVIAMPNPASLQARAFGDRWLALDLPRHLVHVPARGAAACGWASSGCGSSASASCAAARSSSAGCTGSSARCPATPTSTTRSAGPRPGGSRSRRRGGSRSLAAGALALPLAALGARARGGAAPRRHRLRGGPPCLNRADPKIVVVMPALNAAQTLETTVAAIPRDWVDEMILVDDRSTDETRRARARARRPRDLASAQRRLRRQPEDLLPGGAAARRRDRGHAAPRRPVRARA